MDGDVGLGEQYRDVNKMCLDELFGIRLLIWEIGGRIIDNCSDS